MSWHLDHDEVGGALYITSDKNRPATAVEMSGGVVFRYAHDNHELVGITLTNLPLGLIIPSEEN